jgi:preprotein translocase subunit SecF
LYFFGPSATKLFSLILITGMAVGTYSSIFVASPLLILAEGWQKKHSDK